METLNNWWEQKKNQVHTDIFGKVQQILQDQSSTRDKKNELCLALYGNYRMSSVRPNNAYQTRRAAMPRERLKYNVISSMCDTVAAKISKMKPKITFLTSGGDLKARRQAKQLTKFTYGLFYRNDIHDLHQQGFRDSTIFDVGAIKHYRIEDKIISERVMGSELCVDEMDAMYGKPRCLYQSKWYDKQTAMKIWPEHSKAIMHATSGLDSDSMDGEDNHVLVIESWRLPSFRGAGDGRHTICINTKTILDEDYKRDYFPFTFFQWTKPVVGFWGQSLAERLTSNQLEINKMLRVIQKSFDLGATFKVFLEYGSKVHKEHLNNDIGSIVYYAGAKPEFYVPKTVHEQYFSHLKWQIQSAYEEAGVSQLSASSKRPSGVDAAVAMREYQDIESERFIIVGQSYENSFLQTARQYIDLAKEAKEEGYDIEVTADSKRFVERIKWSEIDTDTDDMIMKMYPTSTLPQTPAGKLAYVQDMIGLGYDPDFTRALLDFPDTEGPLDLLMESVEDLMQTAEDMLYKGQYRSPEPFQNLKSGIKLMQAVYTKARREGYDDKKLELLRRWMDAANTMNKKAEQAAMQAQMSMQMGMQPPMGAMPGVMPGPPQLGGEQPLPQQAMPQQPNPQGVPQ